MVHSQQTTSRSETLISVLSLLGIGAYLILRYALATGHEIYTLSGSVSLTLPDAGIISGQFSHRIPLMELPLIAVLILGGVPLLYQLTAKLFRRDLGADLLVWLASGVAIRFLAVLVIATPCPLLIDDDYAATLQFRDEVRADSSSFINHLRPSHLFDRVMLVSGDRESEVRYLAQQVGIEHVYFGQSPTDKLDIVRQETEAARTVFLDDGINDAPALTAATIGIAFGQHSDITSESADAVIMDSSLLKVDELFHISERMRAIALQSTIDGISLSVIDMIAAGMGYLAPVAGAITQEIIDVIAVLNALRSAMPPKTLSDF